VDPLMASRSREMQEVMRLQDNKTANRVRKRYGFIVIIIVFIRFNLHLQDV